MSQDPGQKFRNDGTNFVTLHHDTYAAIDPTKMDLSGKRVLITGASKGVGRAAAASYAKAGAFGIALAARSPLDTVVQEVKTAAKEGGRPEPKILPLKLDVTDRANVDSVKTQVSQAFDGQLDILINNAGYLSEFISIPDTDPDEWWKDWEVNVKGVYLCTRAFWPLLMQSSHRVILNVTSIGAHFLAPGASAYSPTKLAMLRFTEFIHHDNGPGTKDDIVAIGVHPGGVKTELALGMPQQMHELLVDEPALAGDAFAWLGAQRREWLSGRYFAVNHDVTELERRKDEILKHELLKVRMAVNAFPER